MVRTAGTAPAAGGVALPEPTWGYLARRGLPVFAAEGIVPVLVFYAAWKALGLTAGILAATALSAGVLLWQTRRGRAAAVARLTLVFLAVQGLVGIASHSATVYLAQPVVLSAGWGIAYLISAAIGRPLIGLFAQAWYPFPADFRAGPPYRREFGMHAAFIDDLVARGIMVMGGPFADHSGSLSVFENVDEDEARELVARDPFVASGVFVLDDVRAWNVYVDELTREPQR